MGLLHTVENADFSKRFVAFATPVPSGLRYSNFFGLSGAGAVDGDERARRNQPLGPGTAALVGSPVHSVGSSAMSSAACVDTLIGELPAGSVLLAVKVPSTTASFLFGTYQANNSPGVYIYRNGSVLQIGVARTVNGQLERPSVAVPHVPNVWAFLAARWSDTEIVMRDYTHGGYGRVVPTGSRTPTGRSMRIGAAYAADSAKDIAYASIYDRPLTDDEMAAVYGRARRALISRGLQI